MKKMSMYNMKHEAAVSPIVATLVLIVVAVVGAVAVGTIMGTFSTQVGKQANANGAADASATTLLVGGSTTMYPVINALAPWYAANHSGFAVNVQQGGSGAGISGTANGILDIGMFSEPVTAAYAAQYPQIHAYRVGRGAAVVITGTGTHALSLTGAGINAHDLADIYNGASGGTYTTVAADTTLTTGKTLDVFTRLDRSGTADTFGTYAGITNIYDSNKATPEDGNGNMVAAVYGDASATNQPIGFTDFEYWYTSSHQSSMTIVPITGFASVGGAVTAAADWTAINRAERGATTTDYPAGLCRDLNLLTEGPANGVEQSFISFIQQASMKALFNANGMTHVTELFPGV